ncbi:hypothetical protein FJK98_20945 [Micromonospora sp. HM134]|uniref:hypothetical protein n=1 Tax=Micromonospora sp. HM134 TaxID=2583243 RepID=UPI00119854F2|nr:hypothetical protein [Micromonospora sp. HM134]QDY09322.1 hypothetical protein FJK98_20945 [Micromonospora sp. HM134]
MPKQQGFVTVPTMLEKQQGPSCWLYVVEALAAARAGGTGRTTRYLKIIMTSYPSEDQLTEAMIGKLSSAQRRTVALQLVADNLDRLVRRLTEWQQGEGGRRAGGVLTRELLERYVTATVGSLRSLDHLTPRDAAGTTYDVGHLIDSYRQAQARAGTLARLAAAGGRDEVHALLNSAGAMLWSAQDAADADAALIAQSWPSYGAVRKRFKELSPAPGQVLGPGLPARPGARLIPRGGHPRRCRAGVAARPAYRTGAVTSRRPTGQRRAGRSPDAPQPGIQARKYQPLYWLSGRVR